MTSKSYQALGMDREQSKEWFLEQKHFIDRVLEDAKPKPVF